nr:hypothetical protein GCM10020093_037240 [Planobispora longispora]
MALSVLDTVPVALAFAGEALSGFGIGIVYPTLSVLVLELSAPGQEGRTAPRWAWGSRSSR